MFHLLLIPRHRTVALDYDPSHSGTQGPQPRGGFDVADVDVHQDETDKTETRDDDLYQT